MADGSVLRDLWNHHAWADAEHWGAFAAFPRALEDRPLLERLHHLHLTQSAWVWAIGERRDEFVFSNTTDFVPILTLRDFAMRKPRGASRTVGSRRARTRPHHRHPVV